MDFFISNKIKAGTPSEIKHLKSIFGEDWKAGVRKNPDIVRHDPGLAKRAQENKQKEKTREMNKCMQESLTDMRNKGKLTGSEYHAYMKNLE